VPDVTVIIPSYTQGPYLSEAIESALSQEGCAVEVIVIDDGSTDGSPEIAARYPEVTLLRQHRQGACTARNRGLARSTGRHVVFLDADDRMLPRAVLTGMAALQAAGPGAGMAYGTFRRISASGTYLSTSGLPAGITDHYGFLLRRNPIVLHSVLFRREALEAIGGFRLEDWLAADWDLYLRAALGFPAVCHGEVIAERRIHDAQLSAENVPMLRAVMNVMRRHRRDAWRRPAWRREFIEGRRHYRWWFGGKLVVETWLRAERGDWRGFLWRFLALLRDHPHGALDILRRLRRSRALVFQVGGAPAASLRTASATGRAGSLELVALEPASIAAGAAFPVMEAERGLMTLHCRSASARTVVIFDGVPLDTRFESPERLVALVPAGLYAEPGAKQVYLLR
jgi:glycosyltransferase involved in cell wall biosynthesis